GRSGWTTDRSVLAKQPMIFLGKQRAVLERACPAEDGGLRAVAPVGLGGYVPAVAPGLSDDGPHIPGHHLVQWLHGLWIDMPARSGAVDFDPVSADLDLPADLFDHLVARVGHGCGVGEPEFWVD